MRSARSSSKATAAMYRQPRRGAGLGGPCRDRRPARASRSSYVGNIIWPRPGRCFRMVADHRRGGSPISCPAPVVWRGVVTRPDGVRVEVEACREHASS